MRLQRLIPRPIRVRLRDMGERIEGRRLWSRLRPGPPSHESVRVFYGHVAIPRLDQPSHGGLVKFQHMQTTFPNSPSDFNVLYLMSSNRPPGAVEFARLAKRHGVRVVVNQNGVAYRGWAGDDWRTANAPMAALIGIADHVFYQSEFCRRSADRFLCVRATHGEVLYNPVDTDLFVPAAHPGGRLVLLLGGNQSQKYRIDVALRVLALVRRSRPDARLHITGRLSWERNESVARRSSDELARAYGVEDAVRFLGPYAQRDAPAVFAAADILLHTQYNDACPGVVIEAMACGRPVVYSASGGTPELVSPGAGIGVPTPLDWDHEVVPDAEALAEAVLRVADDLGRYSEAARERARSAFDLRPWLARHREVFEALL